MLFANSAPLRRERNFFLQPIANSTVRNMPWSLFVFDSIGFADEIAGLLDILFGGLTSIFGYYRQWFNTIAVF